MKKEYQVIMEDENPYEMKNWIRVMLTKTEADALRMLGFVVMRING